MTLPEIADMLEAFVEEEKRQDDIINQRLAWQTAHLMTATGNYKRAIKSTDLYKTRFEEQPEEGQQVVERFENSERKKEYLKNLMKKFGKELPDYEIGGTENGS